jgi:hypothetical protein
LGRASHGDNRRRKTAIAGRSMQLVGGWCFAQGGLGPRARRQPPSLASGLLPLEGDAVERRLLLERRRLERERREIAPRPSFLHLLGLVLGLLRIHLRPSQGRRSRSARGGRPRRCRNLRAPRSAYTTASVPTSTLRNEMTPASARRMCAHRAGGAQGSDTTLHRLGLRVEETLATMASATWGRPPDSRPEMRL